MPDDHCSTHNQLHPCHVCAIINGRPDDDDRGARDNGFIFPDDIFADHGFADHGCTFRRNFRLHPDDVFAHLDTARC